MEGEANQNIYAYYHYPNSSITPHEKQEAFPYHHARKRRHWTWGIVKNALKTCFPSGEEFPSIYTIRVVFRIINSTDAHRVCNVRIHPGINGAGSFPMNQQ